MLACFRKKYYLCKRNKDDVRNKQSRACEWQIKIYIRE